MVTFFFNDVTAVHKLYFFYEIVMMWLQYINGNFGGKRFKEYVALISIYGYIFFTRS